MSDAALPHEHPRSAHPWYRSAVFLGLLLILATTLLYSNTLHGKFLYDDYGDILDNPSIRQLWPLKDVFFGNLHGKQYLLNRPIPNLTFAINHAIGGLNPFSYHVTNILIHQLAGLSLFGIARRTFALPEQRSRFPQAGLTLPLLMTVFWCLHPLQTESVSYMTQRYESLMGLFSLYALYAAIRSAEPGSWWGWTVLSPLSCLLALGSKEVAVAVPVLILIYDRAFLSGTYREAWRRHRPLYLGLLLAWTCFFFLQFQTAGRNRWAGFGLEVPWWRYALSQPGVILHYLRLVLWPHPLILDYYWPPFTRFTQVLPALVVVAGLLGATAYALVRHPRLGFLGACFFLLLAPTSSFMPILDLAVEHRMYLPLAPVVAILLLLGHGIWQRLEQSAVLRPRALHLTALVLVSSMTASLAAMTYLRNEDYRSPLDIWQDSAERVPWNPRAHYNYAHALDEAGFHEAAIQHYLTSIALAPQDPRGYNNVGVVYGQLGRLPESLANLRTAIRLNPSSAEYCVNLGVTLQLKGSLDNALVCFQQALDLDPTSVGAYNNIGFTLLLMHKPLQAVSALQKAISLQPNKQVAYWNLGNAYMELNRVEEAVKTYQRAADLDEDKVSGQCKLAGVLRGLSRNEEAIAALRKALRLNPNHTKALFVLSWILSTDPHDGLRNGPESVQLASQALQQLANRPPEALDLLAAAQAECGQFQEAAQLMQEAIQKAGHSAEVKNMEKRHDLYLAGKPYRQNPIS